MVIYYYKSYISPALAIYIMRHNNRHTRHHNSSVGRRNPSW